MNSQIGVRQESAGRARQEASRRATMLMRILARGREVAQAQRTRSRHGSPGIDTRHVPFDWLCWYHAAGGAGQSRLGRPGVRSSVSGWAVGDLLEGAGRSYRVWWMRCGTAGLGSGLWVAVSLMRPCGRPGASSPSQVAGRPRNLGLVDVRRSGRPLFTRLGRCRLGPGPVGSGGKGDGIKLPAIPRNTGAQ